jgi:WD40 repeat protein/DNA-binding SARP family transcriptional activator
VGLQFRMLGPLEVVAEDGAVRLGGRRQRAVLAALLLRANHVVPVDQLVDDLYGAAAPTTAAGQVRDHVSQLRKVLGAVDGRPLETRSPGYVLHAAPEQIDALCFEASVRTAGEELLAGEAAAAAVRLRDALALWRGPALADLADEPFVRPQIDRLDDLRVAALEQRLEADLLLGGGAELVGELETLVAEHPLREGFHRQLMLALYRAGRRAEAVEAYHAARRALDELGIEPSPGLRDLVGQMLRQDAELEPPAKRDGRAPPANPYKGLSPFLEADAGAFFGREALTERLDARLRAGRFLVVVGPSGGGKSSVVRAGLVPLLRGRGLQVVTIAPGAYPLEELEAALLRVAVNPPASLLVQLEADERGLLRAVKRVLPDDDSELLLVVDQLEELFMLVGEDERRSHFLSLLRCAVDDPRSRVRIVATLRADFYDRPLRDRDFAPLLRDSVEVVLPLLPDELERAVASPARRAGVELEDGLLAEIVADVLDEPGALPLLQYALTLLFERREGNVLTRSAYRELGGVSGALAQRADALYDALSAAEQAAARRLFLHLVAVDDGRALRRRASRSELDGALVDAFAAARLLSLDRDPRTQDPVVEVAHESLFEEWQRLREWIALARDDLELGQRLSVAAAEWDDAGREPSFLLRGVQLERVEAAAGRSTLAATSLEHAYLAAGLRERDAEQAAARRSLTRLRALVLGLLAAVLVAAGLLAFAFTESAQSHRATEAANARRLAAASVANLAVDPELSLLLGLRAVETSPGRRPGSDALEALHDALAASRLVRMLPRTGSGAVAFSPDGARLATAGAGAAVWDAATGARLLRLAPRRTPIAGLAYSPDGSLIALGGEHGVTTIRDARSGKRVEMLSGPGGAGPDTVAFSPNGEHLAVADQSGRVFLWQLRPRRLVRTISTPSQSFCGVTWNHDGSLLAAANCGGSNQPEAVHVWNRAQERQVFASSPEPAAAQVAAFVAGDELATPAPAGGTEIWNLRTRRAVQTLGERTGTVLALAADARGRRLATGAGDGLARVWSVATGVQLLALAGTNGSVTQVAFSPDGRRLATMGDDGATRIWDITPGGSRDLVTIEADPGGVANVAYAPDGRRLETTGDLDGMIKEWDAQTGALRREYRVSPPRPRSQSVPMILRWFDNGAESADNRFTTQVDQDGTVTLTGPRNYVRLASAHGDVGKTSFSNDSKRVAIGYADGTVQIRAVPSLHELLTIDAHHGSVDALAFSPDDTLLATGGADAALRIWSSVTGRELLSLGGPTDTVTSVAFDPSGTRLAAASADGTVRTYVLPADELVRVARSRLARGWTAAECARYLGGRCPPAP